MHRILRLTPNLKPATLSRLQFGTSSALQFFVLATLTLFSPAVSATSLSPAEQGTHRVDSLNELSAEYRSQQPDSARTFAERAYKLASELNYDEGMATSCSRIGYSFHLEGNFDEAIRWYQKGISHAADTTLEAVLAGLYNNLGITLVKTGDFTGAYEVYLQALEIRERLGDQRAIAKTLNNLGSLQMKRGELDDARDYYWDSYLRYKDEGDLDGQARGHYNLGNVRLEMGDLFMARLQFEESLKLRESMNDKRHMAILYNSLGVVEQADGKWEQALVAYEKSAAINEALGDQHSRIYNLNNIGVLWLDQENYRQAKLIFTKGLMLAQEAKAWDELSTLYLNMSTALEGLGEPGQALDYFKRYHALNDSLFNEAKSEQLTEMQVRYETEKKERENQVLRKDKALQAAEVRQKTMERNGLLVVALLGLLLVVVIVIALRQYRRANRQLTVQKAVIEEREREKAMLLRELHHRVKNNLQVVASLLNLQSFRLKDKEAIAAVTEGKNRIEAMSLIHRDLYQANQSTHIDMVDYLHRLVAQVMQSYGYRDGQVELNWKCDPAQLEVDRAMTLGLILNEVLSNAFKHAFKTVEKPRLDIRLEQAEAGELCLQVHDNGPGLTEEALALKSKSFGMQLISSLAKQLRAELRMWNKDGACIELRVPPMMA